MKNNSGFTLVELLIVIALIGVVAAIGVPNFSTWLPNYRLKAATQDLYSNFQKAKLAAVKRNENTVVRFPSSGYTIFVDGDNDFTQDAGEDVIAQVSWSNYPDVSVGLNTFDNSSGSPAIAFRSDGIPTVSSGLAAGKATLNNANGRAMEVSVSQAGGIRIN
jgi:prepilin-type N-terminal cleavage/methylation domain-containing protein